MMENKKYRLGVLGLGEGRSVISAALQSDRWELINVCDLNEDLCIERQKEFGLKNYTTRYQDMLDDPDIDVIAIYTPDQLHSRHIIQAWEAGKKVICTKPLIVSLSQADELIQAARRTGGTVFVGQSTRFFEPMLHQRQDFDDGRFGDVITMEAQYISDSRWFLRRDWSKEKGFSWMYNFMIHAVDLARWYFPDIAEVYGIGGGNANTLEKGLHCFDNIKFLFKDTRGRAAFVQGCYASPCLKTVVEPHIKSIIRGTKGVSQAEYPRLRYCTHFDQKGDQKYDYSDRHDYYFRFGGENHHAGEYQNYIEYFARCLDTGVVPKPDLEEGIRTIAVMEAMDRSMKTGRIIRIDDVLREYGVR